MIDPITLSVVRSGLVQICDEMDLHLIRSSLSPIIAETNDCAHGIYDPHTGETIAQGELGLPIFLANMQFAVQATLAEAERQGGFRPGDVWIVNDVYRAGTHLNDVNVVAPVFADGELLALIASTGHWMDIGGSSPGGWNPHADDIHQEGLIVPPVRLVEGGTENEALVTMVMANVRLPRQMRGDLTAMSSAVQMGEQRLRDLLERHGTPTVRAALGELVARSEAQMRSYVAEIPDGSYAFEDAIDNDGVVDRPIAIRVRIDVSGSDLTIDFSGTDPASRGPLNLPRSSTVSVCYVALKHLFPDVPINGGTFRPATIVVPDGSVLAAAAPSPVSGYMDVASRVLDVVLGALAQAIPRRVPAAPFGTIGVVTVAGSDADRGYYVGVFPYPGGYGAGDAGDGLVNATPPQSMANFISLEAAEHRYPLRFDRFGVREGSGGAGRHRGGDGTAYAFTVLDDCVVSVLGDRGDRAPFGLAGGGPAATNRVELVHDGRAEVPPMRTKVAGRRLVAGDAVRVASPGGGGFGPPEQRDADALERDLNGGYLTAAVAADVYGAVVVPQPGVAGRPRFRVDRDATEARRGAVAEKELSHVG
jgi:N-methylhydantoinase B